MRDSGLVENAADRAESFLEIEAFGGELCVQNRSAESARASAIDQEAQDVRADRRFSEIRGSTAIRPIFTSPLSCSSIRPHPIATPSRIASA